MKRLVVLLLSTLAACATREPEQDTYFDRSIAPLLSEGCARSSTGAGCHVADARGDAFGNLDVGSFAMVDKRRDLLLSYGPYAQPGLLLKALPPAEIEVRAFDGTRAVVTSDIRHTGGSILDPSGSAYRVLRRWIDAGATLNNTGKRPKQHASLPCRAALASSTRDLGKDPSGGDYAFFRDEVRPVLLARCGDGNCHGNATNDLSVFCGESPEDIRASYWAAVDYLASPAEDSELLRRPLSLAHGGTFHEGGELFDSPDDPGYAKLLDWARRHGPAAPPELGPGFLFFARRVQPVLVRKGCMQMQCHSASIFHDYRLRGGSSGAFSLSATRRNYELSLAQLALESDDVRASRLVRKNLYRPEVGGEGITHRGGALFEDLPAADPAICDAGGYDYDGGKLDDIPALCVVREWLSRERSARTIAPLSALVYVSRELPLRGTGLLDFDSYAPGSDLRIASVSRDLVVTGDRSLAAACGLDPATADIKRPAVSWDGGKIAFAARTSASTPLRIFEMSVDGSGCAAVPAIGAHDLSGNGLLVHDFDPAYSPPLDDGSQALVFASTRGNLDARAYDYSGPQRTPADPSRPNANLYVLEKGRLRQLTFLLNTERAPSFMADGRIAFTVEKRMPGFAQISLRRINLDGGDYHPLYGQRGTIGYREVSHVVHLADRNFAAIFADAAGHRSLGIFNRSLGVDLPSPPDPEFFLRSLRVPDATVDGEYASPSALPDTRVLASWASASAPSDFDVYAVDTSTGIRTKVLGTTGRAEVEAVAVYGRPKVDVYRSSAGMPNAYAMDESKTTADVLMNDADVIFSIMTRNTPVGRPVDDELRSFSIWEDLPPTADVTSMDRGGSFVARDEYGSVYVRRRLVGTVPVREDRSAHYTVPGGVPFVIELPETKLRAEQRLPRIVNEHVMFTAGESVHEGFPRDAFDGFCAGCHGSISGRPIDAALAPDVLSRASDTAAFREPPTSLDVPPARRGAIVGP